jgi:hypothetical protein
VRFLSAILGRMETHQQDARRDPAPDFGIGKFLTLVTFCLPQVIRTCGSPVFVDRLVALLMGLGGL